MGTQLLLFSRPIQLLDFKCSDFLFAFFIFLPLHIFQYVLFIFSSRGRKLQQKPFSGVAQLLKTTTTIRRSQLSLPVGGALSHATWKPIRVIITPFFFSLLALGKALTRDLPSQEARVDQKEGRL